MRWIADLTDADRRRELYQSVFLVWSRHDRDAAAASVRLVRSARSRDAVRRALIERYVHEDVDFAEDLYLRMSDAEQLRRAAVSLHRHWNGRDSMRALRYARAARRDEGQ